MANIVFPDGSSPLFNPGAYGEVLANSGKAEAKKSGSSRTKKSGKDKKRSFISLFDKAAPIPDLHELPPSDESVHLLLDEVHNLGDALSRRPFIEEIKAYNQAVRNFIHYVVENGFTTEEHLSGANLLKRKKFTLIQVIDKKLEEMAAAILQGQSAQLRFLSTLEEINGLLVDLLE
jgi:uncharacterized protein YaaR (DUF327 family)